MVFFLRTGDLRGALSVPSKIAPPPPLNSSKVLLIRMCVEGRAERWRHQQPPQDGQVGRAWQAPWANFGQIQGKTSLWHILPHTLPPCHAPLPGLHGMMASKNFLAVTPNVDPYRDARKWYTNTSWGAA
jgi:hypothetical protein